MWADRLFTNLLAITIFASGFNGLRPFTYATWGDLLFVVLGTVWIVGWPLWKHWRAPWPLTISLLLFVFAYIVSATSSTGPSLNKDLAEFIKFLISFFLLTYLIVDVVKCEHMLRTAIAAYIASGIVNAVTGICDLIGISQFNVWLGVQTVYGLEFLGRANGLTVHPNHLGQHTAMALFLLIGLWDPTCRSNRWFTVSAAVTLFIAVMASGSRGALLAVLGMIAILSAWHYRHIPRSVIVLIIAIVGAAVLAASTFDSVRMIAAAWYRLIDPGVGEHVSDTTRLDMYRQAWEEFRTHPFAGEGYATIGAAHNIYLQVLQSAGVIGTLAFLIYFGVPLWRLRNNLKPRQRDAIALGIAASVGMFLAIGLVSNIIYVRAALIPMGFLWSVQRLRSQ
jgi:O-antigen ligase